MVARYYCELSAAAAHDDGNLESNRFVRTARRRSPDISGHDLSGTRIRPVFAFIDNISGHFSCFYILTCGYIYVFGK